MKTYEELTNAIMNGTAADGSIGEAATVMVNAQAPVRAMPSASNYSDTTTTTAANAKQPSSTTATTTTTTATTNNNNNKNLCRFFFQNMQCRYGSKCRFSHEIPQEDMTREEILKTIPCPHYTRGDCFLGDACELLHPQQEEQEEEEKEDIIDTTCGICLENVYNTPRKQFGLLSCCNHIFCFTCLMEWRSSSSRSSSSSARASSSPFSEGGISSSSRRVCPTCREPSNFVIPSNIYPTTPHEKSTIVQNFKQKCSTKPCRKFVIGKLGSCPFGRDCFYAHKNERGVDMKGRDKTMEELFEERERHRNRRNRNRRGGGHSSDLDMIAEMVMMMALQRQLNGGSGSGGGGGQRRRRRGQAADDDSDSDDSDNEEGGFGINDMIHHLLAMADDLADDESGLPLPMMQLFAAMGAFDGDDDDDDDSFHRDSDDDDDSSLDSMPPLEELNDDPMPPLEEVE